MSLPKRLVHPGSLAEVVHLRRRHPDAVLVAGGTSFVFSDEAPDLGISLHRVEELHRIGRSDRFVEIGATASLGKVLEQSRGTAPVVFEEALRRTGTPALRTIATLGGNVLLAGRRTVLQLTLEILDAWAEFRRAVGTRRVPVVDLREARHPDEFLTRLRVPVRGDEYSTFLHVGDLYTKGCPGVALVGYVELSGLSVALPRIGVYINGGPTLRLTDVESELGGKRLPLTERTLSTLERSVCEMIRSVTAEHSGIAGAAGRLLREFLLRIDDVAFESAGL